MSNNVSFDEILKNAFIETYFQPIVNLNDASILGYEALTRGPKGSLLFMPGALISEAKAHNRMSELDLLMRKMALINAEKRKMRKQLFINVDPLAVYEEDTGESVVRHSSDYGISPKRITVEFSEHSAVCSLDKFVNVIDNYKNAGFSIAFDDTDSPFTSIDKITRVKPDYIKIGGILISGIDTDVEKRKKLTSIITITRMTDAKIIAVGVETKNELETLKSMGVDAAQGNILGVPNNEIKGITDEVKIMVLGNND